MTLLVPRRHGWRRASALALLLFVLVSLLSAVPLFHEWELRLGDTYFNLAPRAAAPGKVALVLIDDNSLRQYGRWPWSRSLLASIVQKLHGAGAGTIGLDILLAEPQAPAADEALRQALANAHGAVIVDKIGQWRDGPHWIEPLPAFSGVAGVGHAQAVLDLDGICRRFPPRELSLDGARFAFALEVARRYAPDQTARFLAAYDLPSTESAGPITTAKPILVPIAFRRDRFVRISAATVLDGGDLSAVRGRVVLVGFGPTEIGDRISTPLSGELPTPGVEVHAQILESVLEGRRLREPGWWLNSLFLLALCAVVASAARRFLGWRAVAAFAGIALAVYGLGFLALTAGSFTFPAGACLMAVVLGPMLAYSADLLVIERSVNRQLTDLHGWLEAKRGMPRRPESTDLFWRLDLLHQLQVELGSAYELHQTLMESTADLVAPFDVQGQLILKNRAFVDAFGDALRVDLPGLRAQLGLAPDAAEGEAEVSGELYAVHIVPLPPTTLSPGGGSIVRMASLHTRVERDRARAEALGFVTHELRTPLVAIQGFAELMMEHPQAASSADAPRTIYQESRRLLELINSYLDVLRLDAGARPLRLETVSMAQLARKVHDLLQPLATAAEMRLVLNIQDEAPVEGDAALLSGAVLNLVSNAIKYARPGTVIRIDCARANGEATLAVRNTGEPIAAEALPRLFDPFYRGTEAEKQAGTGLGLAFVQRILEKHGGTVRAVSAGAEVVFEIRLPLLAAVTAGKSTS